ncbi:MAG: lyase family protein [Candidatus Diapherotrites archaeon]|nr:lyase family protein [Candidatus Diapherotrites archaeon]
MQYRTERDALGLRKIPSGAYYGAFTSRALENFKISGSKPSPALVKALSQVKIASARANMKLGLLEAKKGNAIIRAAKEFGAGKFAPCFALDYFQAGAGTPYNMNANEIIANRATELLGGKRGHRRAHVYITWTRFGSRLGRNLPRMKRLSVPQ